MTKQRKTKHPLLASVLILCLCLSSFIGSTFAWFTDEVSSSANTIITGKLDVKLEYSTDMSNWKEVGVTTNIFDDEALWEPGYTEVVYFRVSNIGNLAMKYKLGISVASETAGKNVNGDSFKLSDYVEYGLIEEVSAAYADRATARAAVVDASKLNTIFAEQYELLPKIRVSDPAETVDVFAFVVYLPEEVGNEANHDGKNFAVLNLGVSVIATQLAYEEDSFGDDYDDDVEFVSNIDELKSGLAAGGNLLLTSDLTIDADEAKLIIPAGVSASLDLNGKTLSAVSDAASASCAIDNKGELSIWGGTVSFESSVPSATNAYGTNTINNSGKLVIESGAYILNTTVGGSSNAIDNAIGAELTVMGGKIESNAIAIRVRDGASAVFNGGEIIGKRAVQLHLISGYDVDTKLTVNGGSFSAKSADSSGNKIALYSYAYGNCTFARAFITITGGTFNDGVFFGGGNKTAVETVEITGGVFAAELGRYLANDGWEDIAKP